MWCSRDLTPSTLQLSKGRQDVYTGDEYLPACCRCTRHYVLTVHFHSILCWLSSSTHDMRISYERPWHSFCVTVRMNHSKYTELASGPCYQLVRVTVHLASGPCYQLVRVAVHLLPTDTQFCKFDQGLQVTMCTRYLIFRALSW